jgi:3-isopropylmalate/(R)-2-methylmalate dehydratase small subunit
MEKFTAFESKAAIFPVDNIDTDQIIPARFLKTISKDGLGDQLFYDYRYDAEGRPKPEFLLNQPAAKQCQVLLAGDNFGCGSSREHAPWALTQYGFRAIVSTSFADIFRNNALKNGLLPVIVPAGAHAELLEWCKTGAVQIDLAKQQLRYGTKSVEFPIDAFSKNCLLEGVDELGYILRQTDAIAAYEATRVSTLSTVGAR